VRTVTTREVVTETIVAQAVPAVPPQGQQSELRYLVKPGDTLWDIAASNYDDVGKGMQAIRRRNGLKRQKVLAGEVLVIPITRFTSSSDMEQKVKG
jgi:LysM repeat protein